MRFSNIIKDFIYDEKYFVALYSNKVHIYKYEDIIKISKELIIIKLTLFNLEIKGMDLLIIKMDKDELLISGNINNIGKIYE